MDQDDHRIFFAGLHFRGREKPSLNAEPVVRPLEVLGLTPRWGLGIVSGQLSPVTDRPGPNFGRHFIRASDGGSCLAIFGNGKVREIAESVKAFRALPDCPDGVVDERQFRDRGSAPDVFGEQDAIRRLPEEGTDRALAILRAIYDIATNGQDSVEIPTVKSFIAHQAFNESDRFTIG